MRKAVVSNTNGTLVVDPMDYPEFRREFSRLYGDREPLSADERIKLERELRKDMEIEDSLYENVGRLVSAIKEDDMGLVIFAGAPAEKTRKIYQRLGVLIDGAYTANGMNRKDPETFSKMADQIRSSRDSERFEPVAYLTNRTEHAIASAMALGKGLLSSAEKSESVVYETRSDKGKGGIYMFSWENIGNPGELKNLIDFLHS